MFFKNPTGFFNPRAGSPPRAGFFPTFQYGGKTLQGFIKNKYKKNIKKLVCLIVQFEES